MSKWPTATPTGVERRTAPPSPGRYQAYLPLLLATVALWFTLAFALDLPRPYWDDTIIIGPSIALVRFGELTNPFLSRAFFPFDRYFFYPPTFSWVLAGWIALFGSSAAALSAYWAAINTVASLALGRCLERLTGSRWMYAAAPVLLFGCTAYAGLRYETLGFASFFAGLALATGHTRLTRLAGYGLLFATPTIAPTFLSFSACATVVLVLHHRNWREAALAGMGLAFAVLVLVLGTGGAVAELVRTMEHFSDVRIGAGGRDYGRGVVLALAFVGCLVVAGARMTILRQPLRAPGVQVALVLAASLVLAILTHLRPSVTVGFNIAVLFLAAWTGSQVIASLVGNRAVAAVGPIAACALLIGLNVVHAVTDWESRLLPDPLAQRARQLAAAVPTGQTIVVDVPVMESLGYPTDRRVEDSMVRNPFPGFIQDARVIPAGETWIVTRPSLAYYRGIVGEFRPPSLPERMFIAVGIPRGRWQVLCVLTADRPVGPDADFDRATAPVCRNGR